MAGYSSAFDCDTCVRVNGAEEHQDRRRSGRNARKQVSTVYVDQLNAFTNPSHFRT